MLLRELNRLAAAGEADAQRALAELGEDAPNQASAVSADIEPLKRPVSGGCSS